jgi:hypothetical protein
MIEWGQEAQYIVLPKKITRELREPKGDGNVPGQGYDENGDKENQERTATDGARASLQPPVDPERRGEQEQRDRSLGQDAKATSNGRE